VTAAVAAAGAGSPAAVTGSGPTAGTPAPARALPHASIGAVPILWNNADLPDLAPLVPAEEVLDEIARLGFQGTQTGVGFPEGPVLAELLAQRRLRLAEVYAALPCTPDGPTDAALGEGRARLAQLHRAGGEVLIVALAFAPERHAVAGRATAPGTPGLTDAGWRALSGLLEALAREARSLGHPLAFHVHAGTYVETAAELDRLAAQTDPSLVGLCLDVGHYTLGGGDPVEAIQRYGERIVHVHLKDVDREVLERIRDDRIVGFLEALRARIFTELGAGVLDLPAIVDALAERDYAGWLMIEQDTTWRSPSESAAIGRAVLEHELRLAAGRPAGADG